MNFIFDKLFYYFIVNLVLLKILFIEFIVFKLLQTAFRLLLFEAVANPAQRLIQFSQELSFIQGRLLVDQSNSYFQNNTQAAIQGLPKQLLVNLVEIVKLRVILSSQSSIKLVNGRKELKISHPLKLACVFELQKKDSLQNNVNNLVEDGAAGFVILSFIKDVMHSIAVAEQVCGFGYPETPADEPVQLDALKFVFLVLLSQLRYRKVLLAGLQWKTQDMLRVLLQRVSAICRIGKLAFSADQQCQKESDIGILLQGETVQRWLELAKSQRVR